MTNIVLMVEIIRQHWQLSVGALKQFIFVDKFETYACHAELTVLVKLSFFCCHVPPVLCLCKVKCKGTAILLQTWGASEGSRKLRLSVFKIIDT